MRHSAALLFLSALGLFLLPAPPRTAADAAPAIPLPEHPRPDFERAEWVNLNGDWAFRFDKDTAGEAERWFESAPAGFPLTIRVPFPWGSKLSGVGDEADVAWYARTVRVPESWKGKRVFLVVGASDWRTSGWLDGEPIGSYQGGYTPFDLELTKAAKPGREQRLVLRVDDTPHPFKLEGKQGYGKARGLWQTVYLEARPAVYVEALEFHPDPALKRVEARVRLSSPAPQGAIVELKVSTGGPGDPSYSASAGARGRRGPRGPPDPAARGTTAPVVARGPLPVRRDPDALGGRRRGPREVVLRPPQARRRAAARARPPVRVAERQAGLPPDDPRPVLEPRRATGTGRPTRRCARRS